METRQTSDLLMQCIRNIVHCDLLPIAFPGPSKFYHWQTNDVEALWHTLTGRGEIGKLLIWTPDFDGAPRLFDGQNRLVSITLSMLPPNPKGHILSSANETTHRTWNPQFPLVLDCDTLSLGPASMERAVRFMSRDEAGMNGRVPVSCLVSPRAVNEAFRHMAAQHGESAGFAESLARVIALSEWLNTTHIGVTHLRGGTPEQVLTAYREHTESWKNKPEAPCPSPLRIG